MSDNQRYYEVWYANRRDYLGASVERAVDAVVAAVLEDLICGAVGAQLVENGRAAAARDIRKFSEGRSRWVQDEAKFYARIAEGHE